VRASNYVRSGREIANLDRKLSFCTCRNWGKATQQEPAPKPGSPDSIIWKLSFPYLHSIAICLFCHVPELKRREMWGEEQVVAVRREWVDQSLCLLIEKKGTLAQAQELSLGASVGRNSRISTCRSQRSAWQIQSYSDSNVTAWL
jgi:hypothetical protein